MAPAHRSSGAAGASQRTKKHSRSRTGCFTCRRRRVKCDEQKPICSRCKKGSRECIYPPPAKKDKRQPKATKGRETVERRLSTSSSGSSSNFDPSDTEDLPESGAVVRFSSASSNGSPEIRSSPDSFSGIQFDQQILVDPLIMSSSGLSDAAASSNSHFTFSASEASPSSICKNVLKQPASDTHFAGAIRISRTPKPTCHRPVQFFLKFHQDHVTRHHYFRLYDYNHFCTNGLRQMAEDCEALRYAIAAFSALIYSVNVDISAREHAFLYYASALQHLRGLLDQDDLDIKRYHAAVATVLQLSTFDRFFNDSSKSFRHLQGAGHIMQKFSDPIAHCSTAVGRHLLEWFCNIEDHCCFLSACKAVLPLEWRLGNAQVRTKLARQEYPRLSPSERNGRLLDDLWAQLNTVIPHLIDVVAGLASLKELKGRERAELAARTESKMRQFAIEHEAFRKSPHVVEITQPIPSPHIQSQQSKHSGCCVQAPHFTPRVFRFPPASTLWLAFQVTECYVRSVVLPALYDHIGLQNPIREFEDQDASYYSVEICRTIAGIEYSFEDQPEALFPCFAPMRVAAVTCPPSLRMWVWCKLTHFEKQGQNLFDSFKQKLATIWNMPEIVMEGFSPFGADPSKQEMHQFDDEEVDIAPELENIHLAEGSDEGLDDEGLEPVTQMRGLFGLKC